MKIYENRQQQARVTHCPTCGNEGHMWMTCPAPAKMMELKNQGKEPDILFIHSGCKTLMEDAAMTENLFIKSASSKRCKANCSDKSVE